MIASALACPDGSELQRAGVADRPTVEALQQRAYARNRELLGLEPVPLLADYGEIFRDCEVWLKLNAEGVLVGALILETSNRENDILIWSVSTDPASQARGLGRQLLGAAEQRARALGRGTIRLYTGEVLTHLIAWYGRCGYHVERVEHLEDRNLVHMAKVLNST